MQLNLSALAHFIGLFFVLFCATWLLPLGIGLIYQEWNAVLIFTTLGLVGILIGMLLKTLGSSAHRLSIRDAFALTASIWILSALYASLPFLWLQNIKSIGSHDYFDALFESTSAITTTGASIFTDPSLLPKAFLAYRGLLQWLGGMGIVVLAVAVFPLLRMDGTRILATEVPGPLKNDKISPRIRDTASILWRIYAVLTLTCALAYYFSGMDWFNAMVYAFITTSTGGLAPHANSLATFHSPIIEWTALIFMLLSSVNFTLHFFAWRYRSIAQYIRNAEFRFFMLAWLVGGIIVFISILANSPIHQGSGWSTYLFDSFFQAASAISSTGLSTVSAGAWPHASLFILALWGAIGGCSGSTTGGVKSVRVWMSMRLIGSEFRRMLHPFGLIQGQNQSQAQLSIWSYLGLFMLLYVAFMVLLMITGLSPFDAFTSTSTTLNNMGIGMGSFSNGFESASAVQKIIFVAAMLLGRLEFFTLMILLTPAFWRYRG